MNLQAWANYISFKGSFFSFSPFLLLGSASGVPFFREVTASVSMIHSASQSSKLRRCWETPFSLCMSAYSQTKTREDTHSLIYNTCTRATLPTTCTTCVDKQQPVHVDAKYIFHSTEQYPSIAAHNKANHSEIDFFPLSILKWHHKRHSICTSAAFHPAAKGFHTDYFLPLWLPQEDIIELSVLQFWRLITKPKW